jgi:hypothetical protein
MTDPFINDQKNSSRLSIYATLFILPLLLVLLTWPGSAQSPVATPTDPYKIFLPQISSIVTTVGAPKPTQTATTPPPADTGSVTGRILWNDQPIAGVTVKLFLDLGNTHTYTGSTGSDGRYTITDIPAGSYYFSTQMADQKNETWWIDIKVTVVAGQTAAVRDINAVKYDLNMLSPDDNAILAATPTLFWEAYPGAASYEVYVSNTVNFEKVTASSYEFANPLAAGKYYWKIYAYNASGTQIATSPSGYYFTIAP